MAPCTRFATTWLLICFLLSWSSFAIGSSQLDGRFSFSLSTFDQSGRLVQVQRATEAAMRGPPVLAAIVRSGENAIILASFQQHPSALIQMDGTARFVVVSKHILVAHSGIGADGRAIIASAQRMAVEHTLTYDEPIPIAVVLEQLSLLFQEYTMKAGARPFGCSLLVAYVPDEDDDDVPQLYRIDPPGSVQSLQTCGSIGGFPSSDLNEKFGNSSEEGLTKEKAMDRLVQILSEKTLSRDGTSKEFWTATLTATEGLITRALESTSKEGKDGS